MKKYRIGEFSKAMGVSHDYLKHYEKNKVLQCERDIDSKYRYFKFADAGKIADTRKYRNMGFSVKEVKKILLDFSLKETLDLFTERRNLSALNLFRLQKQIDYMDEILDSFPSGNFINDKWYIVEKEEFFFFPHTKNNTFYLDNVNSIKVQKWINEQPLTYKTLCVNLDNNTNLDYEYLYGYSADKNVVDKLQLDIDDPAKHIKSGRCFVYYIKATKNISSSNEDQFIPSALNYLDKPLSIMEQCGLVPRTSDIYCKILHRSKEKDVKNYYWILYVPVL